MYFYSVKPSLLSSFACLAILTFTGCAHTKYNGNEVGKLNEANTRANEATKGIKSDGKRILALSGTVARSLRNASGYSKDIDGRAQRILDLLK